jgi:L-malate glycosyltransferase
LRVLYFTRDYTTHDYRFLEALSRAPFETFYLRLEDDGFADEARPLPDRVQEVPWMGGHAPAPGPDSWLPLVPELQRVLDEVRPDIVHAGPVTSCGFVAARAGARPLFTMSWGSDLLVDAEKDAALRATAAEALGAADALVCDCDAVREAGVRLSGRADLDIVQFPWGVDLEVFTPAADRQALRASMGLGDAFVVLSTRRWEPGYDIETLIESLRLARARVPSLRLLLLGDGSLRDRVHALAGSPELEGGVIAPGLVPHEALARYFQVADLYLTCATSDGSSISLLEAIACGLPVVVADTPGNREWVTDPTAGVRVPVGDSAGFADAVARFAEAGEPRRREAGRINRAIACARADWNANVGRLFAAYERAAGSGAPAHAWRG